MLCAFGAAQQKQPDEALLAKAREIHARVITLDTHKDIEPTLALQNFPADEAEAGLDAGEFEGLLARGYGTVKVSCHHAGLRQLREDPSQPAPVVKRPRQGLGFA